MANEDDHNICVILTIVSSACFLGLSGITLGALRIGEGLWKTVPQIEDNMEAYRYSMFGTFIGLSISVVTTLMPLLCLNYENFKNTSFNQAMGKALFMLTLTATWAAGVASAAAIKASTDGPAIPCHDDQYDDDPCHAVNHLETRDLCQSWTLGVAVVGLGMTTLVLGEHLLRSCYIALAERRQAAQRHNDSLPLLPASASTQGGPLTIWGISLTKRKPESTTPEEAPGASV